MGGQADEDITRDLGASWDIVTDMAVKLMPRHASVSRDGRSRGGRRAHR
jgi:hypothetical protein